MLSFAWLAGAVGRVRRGAWIYTGPLRGSTMTQTLTVDKKTKTVKTASKAKTDGATGTKTTVANGRSGLNTKYALAGVGGGGAKAGGKGGRPGWAGVSAAG